ncbi:hypothetical protein JHD49_10515 [Sulfurimonas sp. SAG-AH-194-C21]|nr:hypothetical protein [Sulfurimonas sp. SAG-AH-194-C21]MDF1884374.1 hypothetical protein [Sulfurimonas sp. SAG-AH-194-C21]
MFHSNKHKYYDSWINFPSQTPHKKSDFSLCELDSSPTTNFKHRLKFKNNQNREIALHSDEAFKDREIDHQWMFQVKDVVSFFWTSGSKTMTYKLDSLGTKTLVHYWFIHIVYPLYLTLEDKYYFLHSGAVTINNKAVSFMTRSRGGKSTLTDYFLKQGHTLLTDDKLATYEDEEKVYAVASYPYHRPYRGYETLGEYVENFESEVLVLGTIYILKKEDASAEVEIVELKGIEKFTHIYQNSEIAFLLEFSDQMNYLGSLAKKVSVFSISIPWDLTRLEEVYTKIIQHQNTLNPGKQNV